jgi:simple sugar transport system ATP-binding protein
MLDGFHTDPIIECHGLSKWYSGIRALRDVDFHANRGEVVGLCGDNGAGKSTLIKILSGAHRPDAGTIRFEGREIVFRGPKDAMRAGIETIYQYTALVPQMSIARNIFIGREQMHFSIFGLGLLDDKGMRRAALEVLEDVGLHFESSEKIVADLSGGQRQGVAIARAMHFKSKVLILDEPTNHLSLKETTKTLDFIAELRDAGITCIFITHNLQHVYPLADRLVVMARGEKIADLRREETSIDHLTELIV